jgi:NAD(P)-dependent dehydrogenase (short-subunit alcohol dehydrogenase family)
MFVNMEEQNWDEVTGVHLKGAYCLTRPAFAKMRENRYGRVVMTSSGAGMYGTIGQTNYAAAKMGVLGLTTVLKLEGEKYNIKVNAVAPNASTRMTKDVMPPDMFEKFKVEYITPLVLYLSSEQCQDSGMCINAFGGYFSRSAIVTGAGVAFGEIPSPEQIMEKWNELVSIENPRFHRSNSQMVMSILESGILGEQTAKG